MYEGPSAHDTILHAILSFVAAFPQFALAQSEEGRHLVGCIPVGTGTGTGTGPGTGAGA